MAHLTMVFQWMRVQTPQREEYVSDMGKVVKRATYFDAWVFYPEAEVRTASQAEAWKPRPVESHYVGEFPTLALALRDVRERYIRNPRFAQSHRVAAKAPDGSMVLWVVDTREEAAALSRSLSFQASVDNVSVTAVFPDHPSRPLQAAGVTVRGL